MNEHITNPISAAIAAMQATLGRIQSLQIDLSQFYANTDGELSLHAKASPFSEVKQVLHDLRAAGVDMTLINYFLSLGSLTVVYRSSLLSCRVFFSATDTDEALRAVSGGRCSIQTIRRNRN